MPQRCDIQGCTGNYNEANKAHVFKIPNDPERAKKWLEAIPNLSSLSPSNLHVCERHFSQEDIVREITIGQSESGDPIVVPSERVRLKRSSNPCRFDGLQATSQSDETTNRAVRDVSDDMKEQNGLQTCTDAEHNQPKPPPEKFSYSKFVTLLKEFLLSIGWYNIVSLEKCTLFKMKYNPGPIITYAITVDENLNTLSFYNGCEIVVKSENNTTPFQLKRFSDIIPILHAIDKLSGNSEISSYFSNEGRIPLSREKVAQPRTNDIFYHVSNLLKSVNEFQENKDLEFITEQLNLKVCKKERYRYTTSTMILCSIIHSISPHAYKFLRSSGYLILPHPKTIKSICNKLLTDPTSEERNSFCAYAKNIYKYLREDEKHMILLMDEIHIQPYLDYKGGNIVGTACNNNSLANSAYVFMISGVTSSFKEVVHISPTCNIDHQTLFKFLKNTVLQLEDIGYKIICIISDNNSINSKAMCQFSPNKQLSIVFPHPCDQQRPLFFLFDSVHVLKCVRNNWLNSGTDQILSFPDFDEPTKFVKLAQFHSLKTLHQLEYDKLLRYGYTLSLKSLFPTSLERQNVKLALQIFNPVVAEALKVFGNEIEGSMETSDFIHLISKWWSIVNVKTPLKGKRLKDIFQEPIFSHTDNDPKLEFLEQFLHWLDVWDPKAFPRSLTQQTHTAMSHTTHGLLEIVKYCFQELQLKYVLLGKFQTDALEDRFGKYRQLAGGQYNISVRQLYEGEKKIRILSLLSIRSKCHGAINVTSFADSDDLNEPTEEDKSELSNEMIFTPIISLGQPDFDSVSKEMPVITYLAGYCSFIALKRNKCEECKQNLVLSDELIVEDNHALIKNLSRGSLLYPQETVIKIVLFTYLIFNKIVQENEERFINIKNKKDFLLKLVCKYFNEENRLMIENLSCSQHSEKNALNTIVVCSVNTLLKNYCRKANDFLKSGGRKRKLNTFS